MLTHDVAQPISSIAASPNCSPQTGRPALDIRLELATKIDRNSHRLIKMMNDLQLLFRLDTGSVTARRTPVPVREVVQSAAGAAGDVDIAVAEDVSALADRGHLTGRAEPLKNALAYGAGPVQSGRPGGRHRRPRGAGPRQGHPDELLPNLFDRFMRAPGWDIHRAPPGGRTAARSGTSTPSPGGPG